MGLWDGLDSAEIFDQGNYFPPGQYCVEINRCLSKRSRKTGQDLFIVECDVITSNNPVMSRGMRGSWCQGMKNRNVAMNAILAFVVQIFGLDKNDKDMIKREVLPYIVKTMDRITGVKEFAGENPLGGRMANLTTWSKKKEKDEGDFTVHDWELFDYSAMGLPEPADWNSIRVMGGYGGSQGYGMPPPPMAPAIPSGAPRSPDGKHWWDGRAWQAVPFPPPAPMLPPPPPMAPAIPPGAPRSPDGKHWWNNSTWVLI